MHESYSDITDRIAEPPRWYDEHAVPRYCDFEPGRVANIYATEAALIEVACQSCRRVFRVAVSSRETRHRRPDLTISAAIESRTLAYGDPPNVGCCVAGPTMNSIPLRCLGYWRKQVGRPGDWEPCGLVDRDIRPDWAKDGEPDTSDIPEQGAAFFKNARLVPPEPKEPK